MSAKKKYEDTAYLMEELDKSIKHYKDLKDKLKETPEARIYEQLEDFKANIWAWRLLSALIILLAFIFTWGNL